ncbi:MAG TPA: hypothetical protein DCG10_10580 [Lachnospiraceae bacterium]|nr:hypothetical protein [Lachnospiraceae bacterium]
MSEVQNHLGEKFKETIAEAMKTGDFRALNTLVTDTVTDALREADFQANLSREATEKKVWNSQRNWQDKKREEEKSKEQIQTEREERERQREEHRRQNEEWHRQRIEREKQWEEQRKAQAEQNRARNQAGVGTPRKATASEMTSLVKMEKKGSVSGTLCTVFGGIGLGFSGLGLLVQLLLAAFSAASLSAAILPGVLSLVFLEMISYGNGQRRRLQRAEKYLELCGTKMYGVITEMARYTGKSVRYVKKDLRKMLKAGMFPDGHLDDKETCFMLNDVIYHQYLETEKAYLEQKNLEEQAKQMPDTGTAQAEREQELHSMVAEGMECIRHLRDLNDRIEEEAISEKLYRLENLLKEIFDRVQEHPEQMHRMHKLMDYYLPTTLKLVEQYAEFDEVSSPGEDILDAKKEIGKTLDMINQAFVTLLNNLFQDAAFDASADAQVLQTMLAKEGLTESDFVMEKQ